MFHGLILWILTLMMEAIRFSETSVHIRLHGATSHLTAILMLVAVRTLNITKYLPVHLIY
jgi:hypothetical protein